MEGYLTVNTLLTNKLQSFCILYFYIYANSMKKMTVMFLQPIATIMTFSQIQQRAT